MPVKKSTKRRTQVKDLPRKEKKLSKGEQKKVKGGITGSDTAIPTENISLNFTKTAQKVRG